MNLQESFMVLTKTERLRVDICEKPDGGFVADICESIMIREKERGENLATIDFQPLTTFEDESRENLEAKCREWTTENYGEIRDWAPYQ